MTLYEIKCSQTWAWYEGYVTDFDEKKKLFNVTYKQNWKTAECVPAENIRKIPLNTNKDWTPLVGELVECKAKAEENEPYGWWGCTLKGYHSSSKHPPALVPPSSSSSIPPSSTSLYYVAFDGWGDQHNEMLEHEYIRPRSNEKVLSSRTMQVIKIDVEQELCKWVHSNPEDFQSLSIHHPKLVHYGFKTLAEPIQKASKKQSFDHKNENQNQRKRRKRPKAQSQSSMIGGYIIIIAPERVAKRIKDFLYLKLEQQKLLLVEEIRTQETEYELKKQIEKEENSLKHNFRIHPLLTGFLLGRRRINIEYVHANIPGIVNVKVQNGECQICAQTQVALDNALEYLEIVARKIMVPYHEMAFIIGREGAQIQKLRDESGVIKVVSWNKFPLEFDRLKRRYIERLTRNINQEYEQNSRQPPISIPNEILNASADDLFSNSTTVDYTRNLQTLYPELLFMENDDHLKTDALVIIGRRTRVQLCLSMIKLMIDHLRKIEDVKIDSHIVRNKIRKLKGYELVRYRTRQQWSMGNDSLSTSQSPHGNGGRRRDQSGSGYYYNSYNNRRGRNRGGYQNNRGYYGRGGGGRRYEGNEQSFDGRNGRGGGRRRYGSGSGYYEAVEDDGQNQRGGRYRRGRGNRRYEGSGDRYTVRRPQKKFNEEWKNSGRDEKKSDVLNENVGSHAKRKRNRKRKNENRRKNENKENIEQEN